MKHIYTIFLLLSLILQSLNVMADIPTGLLAPERNDSGPPGSEKTIYQIKMYNSSMTNKLLGKCKSSSRFKVSTGNHKNRGREFTLKCLVDYPFTNIQTDYEFYELLSWEKKNNRHKVKLSSHHSNAKDEYLWVEITPKLKFSNYASRITKNADSFTKDWNQILFTSPKDGKTKRVSFSKNIENFGLDIKKTIRVSGKTWLQIERIYDSEAQCNGEETKSLPYKNLWIPALSKKGKYNINAFSNPRGC